MSAKTTANASTVFSSVEKAGLPRTTRHKNTPPAEASGENKYDQLRLTNGRNQDINNYAYVAGILTRKNPPLQLDAKGRFLVLEKSGEPKTAVVFNLTRENCSEIVRLGHPASGPCHAKVPPAPPLPLLLRFLCVHGLVEPGELVG